MSMINWEVLIKPISLRNYRTALFVLLVGTLLSLLAFYLVYDQEQKHFTIEFQWAAYNRTTALKNSVMNNLEAVQILGHFFRLAEPRNRDRFNLYARALLERHPGIYSLQWVTSLSNDDSVTNKGEPHYVFQSTTSLVNTQPIQKVNYNTDPRFQTFFAQAQKSGDVVISNRAPLSAIHEPPYGVLAIQALYMDEAEKTSFSDKRLLGFVVAVLIPEDVADISVSSLFPRGVEFLLLDESAPTSEQYLGFYGSRLIKSSLSQPDQWPQWLKSRSIITRNRFQLANRHWSIICAPTTHYRSTKTFPLGSLMVLIGGMFFTLFLSHYLYIRERMEGELLERETLFRQLTDTIKDIFWVQDMESGKLLYVSPAYETIWKQPLTSLYDKPDSYLSAVHPDDLDSALQSVIPPLFDGLEETFRIIRDDGTIRWIRSKSFTVLNDKGEPYRIVGVREDVTEVKSAENTMKKSEHMLRALFQQSPDVIRIVDRQQQVIFRNRPLISQSQDGQLDEDSADNLPTEIDVRYRRMLTDLFNTGTTSTFQFPLPDSTWWDMRMVPLRHESQVSAAIVIATNVTEQHLLQAQAIRHARLVSLGILAASVAHEINNPNNAIKFNATILTRIWNDLRPLLIRRQKEDGDFILAGLPIDEIMDVTPQFLSGIQKSSTAIKTIVKNLKRMSRHDEGVLDQTVNLLEVLQSASSILKNKIHKYTTQWHMSFVEDLPTIRGNVQQLEQVFINIILNALQSLPNQDCRVELRAFQTHKGKNIAVEVKDQGIGIPKENLDKIIHPFFSTRNSSEGTGLGLSITATIVANHHGTMTIDSEPGKGTCVTVELPIPGEHEVSS
ncbi:MAG: PAS domain S-box protein [Magnetococcales bacterium]|nr:PAS domain S-box protein [Magnetococcales bacterium]